MGRRRGGVQEGLAAARSCNIAIGNFFFRYRNGLFPVVFLLAVLTLRPKVILDSPTLDRGLVFSGLAVAGAGALLRLLTIGWDYIHRGGKDGQIYAQRLVRGGMYGVTRNPMYVGNALIAIGMSMATGSPLAYLLMIPFFLFVYQAIICAEENFLRHKFGADYEEYCSRVNRFVPSLRAIRESFSGMRYDWRRALRKEMGTMTGLAIGYIWLPVWRVYHLDGLASAETAAWRALAASLAVTLLYGLLLYLKKRKRLFYQSADRAEP